MSKKKIDVYRTGVYLRLSQGDEDIDGWKKQESNSIFNQRLLLEGFIDAHDDLKLVDVFIDDGYTGSNFDRPEFQRMMKSMKAGNLDCIIVKDLSRFGRERIGVTIITTAMIMWVVSVRLILLLRGFSMISSARSSPKR